MKNQPLAYVLTLIFATFFMGSSFIASKLLLRDLAPFWLAGWRFMVAAVAMLPLAMTRRPVATRSQTNWLTVMLVGLLQTTGTMGLLFLSMQTLSAANAAILLFTNPLWVALLSYLFFRERISPQQLVSLVVGLVGVVLAMGGQASFTDWRGTLLGLGSALCWAGSTIITKQRPAGIDPLWLNTLQMGLGGVVLLLASFVGNEPQRWLTSPGQWAWFLWLAVPASAGSFGLWFVALQRGGAARSSSFLFLAPLFATLLSVLVLNTTLTGWQLLGGGLVGLAIYGMNARPVYGN